MIKNCQQHFAVKLRSILWAKTAKLIGKFEKYSHTFLTFQYRTEAKILQKVFLFCSILCSTDLLVKFFCPSVFSFICATFLTVNKNVSSLPH